MMLRYDLYVLTSATRFKLHTHFCPSLLDCVHGLQVLHNFRSLKHLHPSVGIDEERHLEPSRLFHHPIPIRRPPRAAHHDMGEAEASQFLPHGTHERGTLVPPQLKGTHPFVVRPGVRLTSRPGHVAEESDPRGGGDGERLERDRPQCLLIVHILGRAVRAQEIFDLIAALEQFLPRIRIDEVRHGPPPCLFVHFFGECSRPRSGTRTVFHRQIQ
mmetsp:Transcript_35260/g.105340  ORF Transcript_35260/g.105340 Transcript_35260/m.105340 type:complete len:215 (+) Transcript_35260:272-916(+)